MLSLGCELSNRIPSVSLAAVPGRRAVTLDLAVEIEERGLESEGIYRLNGQRVWNIMRVDS